MLQTRICRTFRRPPRPVLMLLTFFAVRSPTLAADEAPLVPAGAVVVPSRAVLTYVEQSAVQHDLKLTPQQQKQIAELRQDLEGLEADPFQDRTDLEQALRRSDAALGRLAAILTPEQRTRHRQIVCQQLLVRFGLAQLVQLADLDALLDLDGDQAEKLKEILQSANIVPVVPQPGAGRQPRGPGAAGPAPGAGRTAFNPRRQPARTLLAIFSNPDFGDDPARQLVEDYGRANERISALLTASQKQQLIEALGPSVARSLAGTPPAIRRPDRGFAFPRIATRAGDDLWSDTPDDSESLRCLTLALLEDDAVRGELQIEPSVHFPPCAGDRAEAVRLSEVLERRLRPGQLARLHELALQSVERCCGLGRLLEIKEVVESLTLTAKQRADLAELLRSERESTRPAIVAAVEHDPAKRHRFDKTGSHKPVADRIDSLLTAEQRTRLGKLLGTAFAGDLCPESLARSPRPRLSARARPAPALGYVAALPAEYLMSWQIQQELKLSEQQTRMISAVIDPESGDLLRILTAEQHARYAGLVLQGMAASLGPAGIYRYRLVIDALGLSEDQQEHLLGALWDDTRAYLRIERENLERDLPALDQRTAATVNSILREDQKAELARLLGEPAERTESAPGRPRFPGGLSAAVTKPGNFLSDEILAKNDEPRRELVVELFLAQFPTRPGADHDVTATAERELSGSIEQVRGRLESFARQGALTKLRHMLLAGREGTFADADSWVEMPSVSWASHSPVGGFAIPQFRHIRIGFGLRVRPRLLEGEKVLLELTLRSSRKRPQPEGDELGLGPDGPIVAEEIVAENRTTQVELPIGQAVLVPAPTMDSKSMMPPTCVVVAVRFAESGPP